MATAILTVGVVFSGKTTFAENIVANNPNYVIIARDDIRKKMFSEGHKFTVDDEDKITTAQYDMIRDCYNKNLNVVITNSNLRMTHLRNFIRILQHYDYDIKLKFCESTTQEIVMKSSMCGFNLREKDVYNQMYLYDVMKDKLSNDSRYNKYIMH